MTSTEPRQYAPTSQPTSGWAIASLVVGTLAVLTAFVSGVGLLLGFVAIFSGDFGWREINRGTASGGGLAQAGRILGVVALVLALVLAIRRAIL